MIKFLKVFTVLFFGLFISCNKDDGTAETPMIPYTEQYPKDLAAIEKYLDEYYIENMTADMGDEDVVLKKIPDGNPDGEVSIMDQTMHPLKFKMVTKDGVDYKLYYLNLREEGNYGLDKNPTRVDSTLVAYRGTLLDNTAFDQAPNPIWFNIENVVPGWQEILPLFKSGNSSAPAPDGTVTYSDFGAGIMFLPSGLGYYNASIGTIPAYAPLVFTFKLNKVRYKDHDGDHILSKDEDLNGNGDFTDDDTDGDGRQNYMDKDDDGDDVLTKNEIKHQITEHPSEIVYTFYYPYNGAAVNDPATLVDETQGIPSCSGDFTTPTRLRKHLDSSCQ